MVLAQLSSVLGEPQKWEKRGQKSKGLLCMREQRGKTGVTTSYIFVVLNVSVSIC